MQSIAPLQREFPADVRLLQPRDIPSAMCLKQAAGWNQTEADWARLLDLQPDGCFAIEQNGALAATATALVYGADLAWIGMVLTAPEHRGQGFARMLMAEAMAYTQASAAAQVGLDATEMGIALYQRFGFEQECLIERWGRPAPLLSEVTSPIATGPWTPDPELDANAFPADRLRLLANLAAEGESAGIAGSAYAMGRPGSQAAYFGPCVAKSPAMAERLLHWFLALHLHETVYWDLLPENPEAVLLARRNGFCPLRRLTRMKRTLGSGALIRRPDSSLVFAIAGFELG